MGFMLLLKVCKLFYYTLQIVGLKPNLNIRVPSTGPPSVRHFCRCHFSKTNLHHLLQYQLQLPWCSIDFGTIRREEGPIQV